MKDANGSRFELLLGQDDWGRCTYAAGDGAQQRLGAAWATPAGRDLAPLAFDPDSASLSLSRRIERLRPAPSDIPPNPGRRLGAAADAFGSVYWLADGGAGIEVLSSGSQAITRYDGADRPAGTAARPKGDFGPAPDAVPAAAARRRLRGLAVTTEQYLVAGVLPETMRPGGLRVHDLIGGGPALELAWPSAWPFAPYDLAPRPDGGLAVLDRMQRRVWMLDRRLGMLAGVPAEADQPGVADDFVPAEPWFDLVVDAQGGADPVSIEVLADGAVLVMDGAGADGFALLTLYVDRVPAGRVSARVVLDLLGSADRTDFVLRGFDCALMPRRADQPQRLVIASHEGNECFAFDLLRGSPELVLDPVDAFLPMRRFDGRGLVRRAPDTAGLWVPQDTGLMYGALGTWLPLVAQVRPRYVARAALTTPLLDSGATGCTWHRLVIDGCVPPGCKLGIETRAADDPAALDAAAFTAEPDPMPRAGGSELPWLLDGPGAHSDAASGPGAWELLFQRANGRYLQLRVTLAGDEMGTPRLFALRAWNPRFSYSRQYLPAIYREGEVAADFLERLLANFEGILTSIEDRIAACGALLDTRSAPDDALDWLASWLGLVFDEAVEPARKRLLIRLAIPLYQYRGTAQGLRLAAALALSPCLDADDFVLPAATHAHVAGIRIVERYLARRLPPALPGRSGADAPRRVVPSERWSPDEGVEGLQRRYDEAQRRAGVEDGALAPFRPVPPAAAADLWRAFCAAELGAVPRLADALGTGWRRHLASLSDTHGMGPELPAVWPADQKGREVWQDFIERGLAPALRRWLGRWQAFLARRYLRTDDPGFLSAWGGWPSFALVPAPDRLPAATRALFDWALFETRVEAMAQAAHRFSVLLPAGPLADAAVFAGQAEWTQRVLRLEKPAHTVFDVQPYWAMFRIGQARVGLDTLLGKGSRAPELAPQLIIGNGRVGASRVAFAAQAPRGRLLLAC
jgi:phage tail-like protein